MRINPRRYPAIILLTFVAFLVVALLLGFRPQHGGGHGAMEILVVSMIWAMDGQEDEMGNLLVSATVGGDR